MWIIIVKYTKVLKKDAEEKVIFYRKHMPPKLIIFYIKVVKMFLNDLNITKLPLC